MSISLDHLLVRNGMKFADFLLRNRLKDYDTFCAYCKGRNISIVSRERFDEENKKLSKPEKKVKANVQAATKVQQQKKPTAKTRRKRTTKSTRKTSKSQT